MNKRQMIQQKIAEWQKQLKDLDSKEQQQAGAYIIGMFQKGAIKDSEINAAIAKILGEESSSNPVKTDNNVSTSVE